MKAVVYKVNDLSKPEEAAPELDEIERLCGVRYPAEHFFEIWGWTEERGVAEQAAFGAPEAFSNLDRDELCEAFAICREPGASSEFIINFLERCFPKAFSSDLLYYPHRDMTDEEVADEVFRRKRLLDEGGEAALGDYLIKLAEAVMADPAAKIYSQQWAHGVLNSHP